MLSEPQQLIRRLRSVSAPNVPAFIGGLGSNGLSFVRSLGRRSIPVIAMDTWYRPEMVSRYAQSLIVPDPATRQDALLQLCMEIGEELGVRPILIPTSDAFTLFVSKYEARLSKYFDFIVPDYETVLTLTNKRLQYDFALEHGVPIPDTFYPSDLPIEEIARLVPYPCIIKPYFSHLWLAYRYQAPSVKWGKVAEVRSR